MASRTRPARGKQRRMAYAIIWSRSHATRRWSTWIKTTVSKDPNMVWPTGSSCTFVRRSLNRALPPSSCSRCTLALAGLPLRPNCAGQHRGGFRPAGFSLGGGQRQLHLATLSDRAHMSSVYHSDRHASTACVLIADDLSGACDAGVWFARIGLLTRVALGGAPANECDVLVVSTDSRNLTTQAAAEQVRAAAGRLPLASSALVFKKIDSTFRGPIAAECDALISVTGAPYGVIVPAVPSQGRTVADGILCVEDIAGGWTLDLREALREQGAVAHVVSPRASRTAHELASAIMRAAAPARYVLCDASSDEDLALAAEALFSLQPQPLWIGASGLAKHAAGLLRSRAERGMPKHLSQASGPVVLCIGSNHEVTLAQVERVPQAYSGRIITNDGSAASRIRPAAEGASPLVVIMDISSVSTAELRASIEQIRSCSPAAILVTGGDTAALICRAAEARGIVLEDEVVSGVPAGRIEGGLLDGVRLATKSGGFGAVDCLVECIRRLSSSVVTGAR